MRVSPKGQLQPIAIVAYDRPLAVSGHLLLSGTEFSCGSSPDISKFTGCVPLCGVKQLSKGRQIQRCLWQLSAKNGIYGHRMQPASSMRTDGYAVGNGSGLQVIQAGSGLQVQIA